ncbi:hypothetical protein ABZ328_29015 [Micromonospora aurantiaca]|uniref:hypothetical protein n=1 Tax=Micromonospora aurantiaca (nom. illeg.) TaxID=47850 RepID=UPI0033F27D3F
MGRPPKGLNPDNPLHAFAIELKIFRDRAGFAGTAKATCGAVGINRTTYYAWLAGKQLPGRDVLELTVRAWSGDLDYWLQRRRQAEAALAELSSQRQAEAVAGASQQTLAAQRLPVRSPRRIAELEVSPQFDAERRKRVDESREALQLLGFDEERSNERSSYILLSLLALGPETPWAQAQMPVLGLRDMMEWIFSNYLKAYAPNSREGFRRLTLHQFCAAGFVIPNPDRPDRPINSPQWCYQLAQSYYPLLCSYGTERFEGNLKRLKSQGAGIQTGSFRH